ncbi:uncharacterized protein MYCGRDRAFT_89088 [Zymoseptoria tritici IPO323]|uniref:1-alkyl-2-acetylglycerophosphocholine esterase n=1 Tax=Zymoseptoria tritici (strain CBS 115943 / IPO323) TaxID=336722 RepID=F9WXT3_ZYMTI|nr:uncharacterized protein MYCGRDRAFT_89088 [Zymoseptoria tritici IPO323]EGP92516.1 hypothetical protein MYCGRDRAFT_89088 [Zymoseptoria tritici IPO323]
MSSRPPPLTQTITLDSIPYHTLLSNYTPTRPLILLIHALMSNHEMYDPLLPILHAAGYATLSFDHVGHNLTPCPTECGRLQTTPGRCVASLAPFEHDSQAIIVVF